MALLDLKTNLKSLKYGSDTPGGGNSGQPYQQVDINTTDSSFNRFRMTKFDDGLVRGGVVGAANASIVDTFRIGKFLKDFPKGPLFIVKQIGLQLSNPQIEHKTNFSTNRPTREQGLLRNVGNFISNTANKILNTVGPTRIYNLGINTLAQVPVNAFGQHIVRHGFTPRRDDDNLYFKVAKHNNNEGNNRLVQYKKELIGNSKDITSYIGGPSSIYGIGNTIIRRRGDFIIDDQDTTATSWATSGSFSLSSTNQLNSFISASNEIRNKKFLGLSYKFMSSLSENKFEDNGEAIVRREKNQPFSLYDTIADVNDPKNSKYVAVGQEASASAKMRVPSSFVGASLRTSSSFAPGSFPNLSTGSNKPKGLNDIDKLSLYTGSITWTPQNGEDNETFGLPAKSRKVNKYADLGLTTLSRDSRRDLDVSNFTTNPSTTIAYSPVATGNVAKYAELRNVINAGNNIQQNYFKTTPADKIDKKAKKYNVLDRTNDVIVDNDTLSLQFTPLDPFTGSPLKILKFLGYINSYTEDYNSSWGDIKYAGRGEKFYIFNEFKRTATVDFNIPCYNYNELILKHCTLSELASTLAGKYKDNLLLGGIITKLKVGNYINNQPGIITNLNFSPIQDSSWDLDAELAFYLRVSFGFTIIHNYLPQYADCGFIYREPDPIIQPPKPPPETTPAPTPPVTSSVVPSNNTGSYLEPLGRVDLRDRPVSTFVRKPYILDDLKKVTKVFGGFGEGSFGGGGGGGLSPRPGWE